MIRDYKPSERVTVTDYELSFWRERGWGLGFPCDKDGNVDTEKLTDGARENLEHALAHPEEFPAGWKVVEERTRSYREDATGTCTCGKKIRLWNEYLGACECPRCHRWWNMFGDELKNPRHWNDYGELDYEY